MLKGKLINSYPKNGKKVFVFKVTGTDEEKLAFLEAQEAAAARRKVKAPGTDEDGDPLYWSSSPTGRVIDLKITQNGVIVEDTTDMDLGASAQANKDFTYNQVMDGLKQRAGLQGNARITGNAGAAEAKPTGAAANGKDESEDLEK